MPAVPLSTAPPGADRRAVLLRDLDPAVHDGLEIGPSVSPVVTKASGARIRSVDHADAATLRAKYGVHPGVDVSGIEEVDHVWPGGRLRHAVPDLAAFDYVLASHVLEHLPNPLAFLQDCFGLLRPGGRLVVALPDHRFCFDHARPVTTFGQWLDAYDTDRQLHTPGTVVDHLLHAVQRGGEITWSAGDLRPLGLVHTEAEVGQALGQARLQDQYLDVHAWVFNPHSFAGLVEVAQRLGLVDLRLHALVDTLGAEFFAVLVRPLVATAPPGPDGEAVAEADRLARLLAARQSERSEPAARRRSLRDRLRQT